MTGNKTPLISIIASSFNHEKYVHLFIESVLAQTNPDWELIIVDDCSTDDTVAEIKKFKDSRITFIQQQFNMGVNCALSTAFQKASGKYVVFFASDDMMAPDFIDTVSQTIKQHPNIDVIYPYLQCINENNKFIDREILPYNANRFDILRELFYNQNVMTSPGMIIKHDALARIMPLDIGMSQHHDYQIHIKLLLNSDCYILTKKLVLYRIPSKKSGMSFATTQSERRCDCEEKFVMDTFLNIKNVDLLAQIFGDDIKPFGKITPELIPYILGCLAIQKSQNDFKKMWGYNIVAQFINTQKNYALLNKLYSFGYSDFLNLANNFSENIYKQKYNKYKKLFNITLFGFGAIVICFILFLTRGILL